jgi:putative transposase
MCTHDRWWHVDWTGHSVFDQHDAESVVAQYDRVLDALADKFPKMAEHLDAARAELLAFTAFSKQIWRQIWSNNPYLLTGPGDTTCIAA